MKKLTAIAIAGLVATSCGGSTDSGDHQGFWNSMTAEQQEVACADFNEVGPAGMTLIMSDIYEDDVIVFTIETFEEFC